MDKLPNASNTSVNVNHNETVDSATINRPFNRLLENDIFNEGHVQDILSTIINEGLEGEIANFLGLDETYINGILNDIADNNGTSATLGDLDDVGIIDVEDKDIIRYEQGVEDFVNVSSEDDNNIDAYIEDFVYLNDITHEELSVEPTFEYQDDIRIYTYEYDGNLFRASGNSINPKLIKGFYLDISLFGIVNNNASEGNGGVEWSVSCNYPDGEEYVVLKYHAENVDDDGGIGQNVFVPYNYKITETFKITVRLENNQSDWKDTNGRDLNYLKISKIKAKNIDSNIDSEKNQQLINGSVDPNDAKIMSDGFIESGSSGGYQIWDSATNTNYSEWSDVIPIIAPERTAKTIIEFENYTITEGISSGDVGASSGAVGSAIGRVVIDWITEDISGNVNLYKGSGMSLIGSAVLQGNVNSTSSFNMLNNSLGGVDIALGIKTNFRLIAGLPIVIDNYLNIALGKVQYVITHYNTKGANIETSDQLYCDSTQVNEEPHGLSNRPSMGLSSITEDGGTTKHSISRYFSFSQQDNGTDGGLKYKFNIPYQYMDSTNVGINKKTFNGASFVDFPAGNRYLLAQYFSECEDQSPAVPPPPPIPPGYVAITNDGTWSETQVMSGELNCRVRYPSCSVSKTVSFSVNGVATLEWTKSKSKISRFDEYYGGFHWRIRITDPNFTGPLTVTTKARTASSQLSKTVNYFVIDA